jgi:hypothetical protein
MKPEPLPMMAGKAREEGVQEFEELQEFRSPRTPALGRLIQSQKVLSSYKFCTPLILNS